MVIGGLCHAGLLVLGLVPFVLRLEALSEHEHNMAKPALPSLKVVQALSATTFEGSSVKATQLFSPGGAVFFMIRRMG